MSSAISSRSCWRKALSVFFFNDTATTEIYTLSLHDALPIFPPRGGRAPRRVRRALRAARGAWDRGDANGTPASRASRRRRSEEHTSELQSQSNLVCRLLLEKKTTVDHDTHLSACLTTTPQTR